MELEIHDNNQADAFCSIFQHMKLVSDTINLMFNKERLYVQALDSGNIVITEIFLPANWFHSYKVDGDGVVIGITVSIFYKVLNTREKGQTIHMAFEKDNDRLQIKFTSKDPNIYDKRFELPLVDLDTESLHIPEFESHVDIELSSSKFASIINQMIIFSDSIEFDCKPEKIVCSASGNEAGKMEVVIDNDIACLEDVDMKLGFSLHKLHDICMYSKISKNVVISLTENFPIRILYDVGGGDGKLYFYLAPKIEND